jgi:splicing factor U2AF subunit
MDVSAVTRHARRLYAGGIPPTVTEAEVRNFFNEVITRALGPHNRMDGQPVIGVYLNLDKCYAFVELPSVELTNACMQMDGLRWDHYTGPCVLRIRRPNDYRPELVANAPPPPQLDMDYLTRMGVSSPDGPGKIFVGGLPYNLPDDDLKELLGAFGPLKSFHQVREGGIGSLSKGYGFCEYFTKEASDNAVSGLNGLQLGDKTLTVRYATGSNNPQVVPPGQSLAAQLGVNFSSSSSVPAITYPSILAAAPTRVSFIPRLKYSHFFFNLFLEHRC